MQIGRLCFCFLERNEKFTSSYSSKSFLSWKIRWTTLHVYSGNFTRPRSTNRKDDRSWSPFRKNSLCIVVLDHQTVGWNNTVNRINSLSKIYIHLNKPQKFIGHIGDSYTGSCPFKNSLWKHCAASGGDFAYKAIMSKNDWMKQGKSLYQVPLLYIERRVLRSSCRRVQFVLSWEAK